MSEAEVQAAGSREAATDTFLQRLAEQVLGVDVFVIASDGLGKTELSTQTYTNWAGHQVLVVRGGNYKQGVDMLRVNVSLDDNGGGLLATAAADTALDCNIANHAPTA